MKKDLKLIRLTDANLNRASEGLRVAEDIARFMLDHASLAEAFKSLRHEVRKIYPQQSELILARDSFNDVGQSVDKFDSLNRSDPASLVRANLKRAQEALRVLEETAKLTGLDGEAIEKMRYRCYGLEKEILLVLSDSTS